jgi:NAD-reducing hydrogenase large subunit
MSRRIVIDPVTRIEGHARVTIELDDKGAVTDAHVHVAELRGIETLCEGRPLRELPALTARICGICPVSHSLAAALAGDVLLGADPPPAAKRLRELVQLAQVVQSHALSFFHLSGPDFVLGPEADPARRSLFGLAEAAPALARDGVLLRRFGQETIERVTGQRVHTPFAVPGGVTRALVPDARERVLADLPAAFAAAERAIEWWRGARPSAAAALDGAGRFESLFLALVEGDGTPGYSSGTLRMLRADGSAEVEALPRSRFREIVGEAARPWTYTRLAFYRPAGHPGGLYRVGPLARLNAATRCGTARADRALAELRATAGNPILSSFDAHGARLVELLHGLERIEALLADPETSSADVLAPPGTPAGEAVGCCEAPRGTLFHHYRVDAHGLVTWANFVVATGQNALAMDRSVRLTAERWLEGGRITPPLLVRVEAAVRAFDPCFSCATHAIGGRVTSLRLVDAAGRVLDER